MDNDGWTWLDIAIALLDAGFHVHTAVDIADIYVDEESSLLAVWDLLRERGRSGVSEFSA